MGEPFACARKGKWIGGCRFEARYEYGKPIPTEFPWGWSPEQQIAAVQASRPTHYVGETCVTCGRMIERDSSPSAQDGRR